MGLRILVADDNEDAADTLGTLLEIEGHDVRMAYDGQQAVDMAAASEPEVAILDIEMPRLNGFEAAARIRALSPNTRLIALTAYTDAGSVARGFAAGFVRHLAKPVELATLRAAIKSAA